jgi:hypothetical protein
MHEVVMPVVQGQVHFWQRLQDNERFQDNTNMPRMRILFDRAGFMTQTFIRFELFILLVTEEQSCRKGRDFVGEYIFLVGPAETFARAATSWDASC